MWQRRGPACMRCKCLPQCALRRAPRGGVCGACARRCGHNVGFIVGHPHGQHPANQPALLRNLAAHGLCNAVQLVIRLQHLCSVPLNANAGQPAEKQPSHSLATVQHTLLCVCERVRLLVWRALVGADAELGLQVAQHFADAIGGGRSRNYRSAAAVVAKDVTGNNVVVAIPQEILCQCAGIAWRPDTVVNFTARRRRLRGWRRWREAVDHDLKKVFVAVLGAVCKLPGDARIDNILPCHGFDHIDGFACGQKSSSQVAVLVPSREAAACIVLG